MRTRFRGVDGIWTRDEGFADPCLTTWPRRHFIQWGLLTEWFPIRNPPCLSGRWDSNPRPSPWQGDVLPLYYARRFRPSCRPRVPRPRIELGTPRFSVACSTNWAISAMCLVVKRPWFYTQLYIFVKKSCGQSILLVVIRFWCLTFLARFDIILGRCPKGQFKLFHHTAK